MTPKEQYRKYLETRIRTASREDLVVLLYEGMVKYLEEGEEHLQAKRIEEAGEAILRVQGILLELLCALDDKASPEVAGNLKRIYLYLHGRLLGSVGRKDAGAIREVKQHVLVLKDAWIEAVQKVKKEARAPSATSLHGQPAKPLLNPVSALNLQA